jgi:hypothetical protein
MALQSWNWWHYSPGPEAIWGGRAFPPLSVGGGGRGDYPCHISKQEMGAYIHSLLYTYTGLLGWLLHEVFQLLMWWRSRWPLGQAKEASCAAFSSLPPSPWDYGIVFVLQPGPAEGPSGRRNFYSWNTLAVGLSGEETCCDFLYLVGSPQDELRFWLQLSLVPGRTRPYVRWKSSTFGG